MVSGEKCTFRDLGTGDLFVMGKYGETGLSVDLGKPGSHVYRKVGSARGARRYECAEPQCERCKVPTHVVGSINVTVWPVRA